jgi:hypothetical protein
MLNAASFCAHPPARVAPENDSVNGYYTSIDSLFGTTGFHTSETVNIFGVRNSVHTFAQRMLTMIYGFLDDH